MRLFKLNKIWFRISCSFSNSSLMVNNKLGFRLPESMPSLFQWKKSVGKAEKYLNSDLSNFTLKSLLSKESEFAATTLERTGILKNKLGLQNHPIIGVIENLFSDSDCLQSNNTLSGFYLLLLAKMTKSVSPLTYTDQIWEKQKAYAEVCEIDKKISYIHSAGLIDIPNDSDGQQLTKNLNTGNKLSILSGDYLFALSMAKMSQSVVDTDLLHLNGLSIDNFCTTNFNNNEIDWTTITFKEWTLMPKYDLPISLGNYASGIVKLANLATYEKAGFNFGYNIRIKWNIEDDLYNLIENKNFELLSAPVIIECENNPRFAQYLNEIDLKDKQNLNKIREKVLESNSIQKARDLIVQYAQFAIASLNNFPNSKPKSILIDLIENEKRQDQGHFFQLKTDVN